MESYTKTYSVWGHGVYCLFSVSLVNTTIFKKKSVQNVKRIYIDDIYRADEEEQIKKLTTEIV